MKEIKAAITERRKREIEAVKGAILQAARKLAIEDGWPKVSIRKIAVLIQYTPPVIYEHFKNKEAILIELESQGFRDLYRHMVDTRETKSDPKEQVLAMTETFWDWAFKHAELYQVMFNLEGIRASSTNPKALRETGDPVLESLRQIQLFAGQTDEPFFHWWALVHGYVSMVMCGQITGMDSQMKRNLLASTKRFVDSLG
ncbi:MAG: TetR/AcrR family transcriptional regulator [Bacteroidota bacterium]